MQEIIIHNWDELQRVVFDDVWDDKIMRYRDNRIYRGMAEQSWDLIPSLNRVCGHDLSLETQVFRSFRKYGYAELAEYSGFWKLLPVAQHHGLPTRLLDWTYSPLVAAHFATEDTSCYDRDGVIWCLDVTDFRKFMPAPLVRKLADNGQIITQYVDADGVPGMDVDVNPNGSIWAIEGITSPDGRVLGKMGHAERIGDGLYRNVDGCYDMKLFQSAKKYFDI